MPLRRAPVWPWIAVAFLAGAACGRPRASRVPPRELQPASSDPFPSRRALLAIAEASPPPVRLDDPGVATAEWTLASPLPARVGATPDEVAPPWAGILDAALATGEGLLVPTGELACVAREAGRHVLATRSPMPARLRRFVAARCGVPVASSVGIDLLVTEPALPEAALFEKWRDEAGASIDRRRGDGDLLVGLWVGRQDGAAVLAIATSPHRAEIEPFAQVPGPDGAVHIRGEALVGPAGGLRATVNRGRTGSAACTHDRAVKPPRFAVSCVPDPGDDAAWLSVTLAEGDDLAGTTIVETLVWPRGSPPGGYREPPVDPAVPAARGIDELEAGFLAELNAARAALGLPPLARAGRQSAMARRLLPHFLEAISAGGSEPLARVISAGLCAGWDLERPVTGGQSGHVAAVGGARPARLLEAALERPSGRRVLLDPTASALAIGAVISGGDAAAIFATYRLIDPAASVAEATALLARLDAERAARGNDRVRRLVQPAAVAAWGAAPERAAWTSTERVERLAARAARAVEQGRLSPVEAVEDLIQRAHRYHLLQGDRHAWAFEPTDLSAVRFPAELLDARQPGVIILSTFRRPAGQPRARRVVIVIAVAWRDSTRPRRAVSPATRR